MTFQFEVNINGHKIKGAIEQEVTTAQQKLDAAVLQDSNYFIPKDTGALESSGIINTRIGSGVIKWRTPYARRQYYGEDLNHAQQRNPNACAKWFEAAKARYLKKWRRLVNDSIRHN